VKNIFIYNLEPRLALPVNEEEQMKGIEYCESVDDFANMGISCFGSVHIDLEEREIISTVAAPWNATTRNFFRRTASNPDILIGGFNSSKFDDVLLSLVARAGDKESDLERIYTLDKIGEFNNFSDFKHRQIAPYLYQQNEIPLMLSHCQESALVQAQTLLMLLDGNLIDPNTTYFLEYEFPREITNLGYD
jgi:hypothetical protein